MEGLIHGAIGGLIPGCLMVVFYIIAVSGRLARIETNIDWLIKIFKSCPPHLKNHIQ
jgi:hypothetical protein